MACNAPLGVVATATPSRKPRLQSVKLITKVGKNAELGAAGGPRGGAAARRPLGVVATATPNRE
ncbi:hypothetical protein KO495_07415 [Colwellia sp. D2M02]|uniref:hypothetical protein n=1 Tax=Colwellia sp. D2M02 TaxID=2841562 RepID=UPI001C0A34D3|nr:hypothetical protein [Colwellia sp. D2M02]MBU2893154.1 hypothetical protein [Colwellia sp. D2M02]